LGYGYCDLREDAMRIRKHRILFLPLIFSGFYTALAWHLGWNDRLFAAAIAVWAVASILATTGLGLGTRAQKDGPK
jgi:hypothetical protein